MATNAVQYFPWHGHLRLSRYLHIILSLLSQPPFNADTSLTVFIMLYQEFEGLVELITSSGNYSRYRQRFSECTGFRFPILGVHLKDLIAVHVALPDWADREKTQVNLTKTQQLYAILQELALIQATPPKIDANPDLLNLLIVSLGLKCVSKHGLSKREPSIWELRKGKKGPG